MTFKPWVENLNDFFSRETWPGVADNFRKSIAPPLVAHEKDMYCPIPDCLLEFWRTGAAEIECDISLEFSGTKAATFDQLFAPEFTLELSVSIMNPRRFETNPIPADYRADFDADDATEHSRLWKTAIPFCDIGNGDYIAIDAESGLSDPPVVVLVHEDDSSGRLSDSFTDFLSKWQDIYYLHPFLLAYCCNDHGLLLPSTTLLQNLRDLLDVGENKPRTKH